MVSLNEDLRLAGMLTDEDVEAISEAVVAGMPKYAPHEMEAVANWARSALISMALLQKIRDRTVQISVERGQVRFAERT